jgi:hypothetical protein
MNVSPREPDGGGVRGEGPWPFVTRYSFIQAGRRTVRGARQHRKGLGGEDANALPFWQRARYNWSTGAFFAVGSLLFMLGSLLSLIPTDVAPSTFAINVVLFLGSVPFTIAGYLQHFQAANTPAFRADGKVASGQASIDLIGWNPRSPGWLSTFTQFIGTLAFNVSTFNAIVVSNRAFAQDLAVWTPDVIGSALFLVSGYLAFLESSHGYWSWKPKDLAWQIVFVNLLGCVAFMTSGILAYVPTGPEAAWIIDASNSHLLLGALCFFIGAVLSMKESRA